jgi:rhodanese-related sulfurtransferase
VLVDARTAGEFAGSTAASSEIPRPGHIPGATNVYWMQTQASKEDMTLIPEADLRKLYESLGVKPDRPVVTYCNTGMQASQSYFTLKYLGYDTHMYDGSFSQWSAGTASPMWSGCPRSVCGRTAIWGTSKPAGIVRCEASAGTGEDADPGTRWVETEVTHMQLKSVIARV